MQSDPKLEGLSLMPVSIIALGTPAAPVERLVGLQSAIARSVDWLAGLSLPRFRPTAIRFHPTRQGEV